MTTGGVPFTEAPDEDNFLRDFLNSNNHGRGRSVSLPSTATNGELMFAFPTENREAREEIHTDERVQLATLGLGEAGHMEGERGAGNKSFWSEIIPPSAAQRGCHSATRLSSRRPPFEELICIVSGKLRLIWTSQVSDSYQ